MKLIVGKLHLEMKLNKFNNKGKENTVVVIQEDLGSNSGDETKITTMVIKGKELIASTSISNYHTSTPNEETRIELFHVRVISKHTKIDTLFDSGSQANLISDDLVKQVNNLILKPFYIPSHIHWVEYARAQTYRLQELYSSVCNHNKLH